MPIVSLAEVQVTPTFTGTQSAITKKFKPAAEKAGRSAGQQMGVALAEGLASETKGFEAEVTRLAKSVSGAQDKVSVSRARSEAAAAAEERALGAVRVAELKLAEARDSSRTSASQVAAAEERVAAARGRATVAATARTKAETDYTRASKDLGTAQHLAARASEDLETHLKRVESSSTSAERSVGRLGSLLSRSFRGRPLADIARSIREDAGRIDFDLHRMAQNVSQQGTRGGRAFTQGFAVVSAGLALVPPVAGAAGSALIAASGSVATLAGSIKDLGGVAALAPAALIAVGAGAGVLRAALFGVGDALQAAVEGSTTLAGNARLDALALQDSARQITRAEQRAADVRIDAARRISDANDALTDVVDQNAQQQAAALRRVEDAERQVERTNRRVTESQLDLNQARADAVQRVRDLSRSLEQAELSERAAALRLEDARTALADGQAAGSETSSRDLKRLQLDLDEAALGYRTAQEDAKSLREEQTQAAREGVKGNQRVISAEQAVTDAVRDREDALRAQQEAAADVVRTEQEGAERIADAQQAIADATAEAGRAQADAADAVTDAYRNLEQVQLQQADAAGRGGQKAADAMGKLTPNAQAAVRALLGVYDQLGAIRRIAQENFFAGFTGPLQVLAATVLPQLATGVGAIASAFGGGAQQLMTSLADAFGGGVLEGLLLKVAETIGILNGAIDPVVQAFVTLGVVGMDYMPQLAESIRIAATEFNTFIQGAAADGSLRGWIDAGLQGFRDLASIIGSLSGIFGAVAEAARAGGIDTTLGSVADNLNRIEAAVNGSVFQTTMATIFGGAAAGARGLADALGPIGEAFRTGAPALAEFLRLGGEIAGTFIGGIFDAFSDPAFGAGLTTFMEALLQAVRDMAPLMPGLAAALGDVLTALAPIAAALGPTVVEVITIFATALATVLEVLGPLLTAMAGSPALVGLFIAAFTATAAVSGLLTFAGNLVSIITGFGSLARVIPLLLNPIGLAIAAVVALIAIVGTLSYWFFNETEAGKKFIDDMVAGFLRGVNWFRTVFVPGFLGALDTFRTAFRVAKDFVVSRMEDIRSGINDKINAVKGFFTDLGVTLSKVPDAFRGMVTGAMKEFDKLRDKAKVPIRFVIEDVFNKGLIGSINSVLERVNAPTIKPIPLPAGFKRGGYTGDGNPNDVAGPVHKREYVFTAAQTAALGKENLAAMAHAAVRGGRGAASDLTPMPGQSGFFTGNVSQIARHGAIYMDVASGMGAWDFPGAARMWDGAAGVKVAVGRGRHQGYARPLERGGGILGYATGTNIDMSPSWMGQLSAENRRKTAAHELGHVLGLPHFTGVASIMNPFLGNQAGAPTSFDIRALQKLYPGGSGKAGDGTAENPFDGLIDALMGKFKEAFPGGGMFIDVAGGLAKSGLNQVVQLVADIRKGIANIAGDVVGNIKEFFGFGASTEQPLYRDEGGILPPGVSRVLNATGQDEYVLNRQQWRDIHDLALAGGGGGTTHQWHISAEPGLAHSYAQDIARQGEQRSRDMAAAYGNRR